MKNKNFQNCIKIVQEKKFMKKIVVKILQIIAMLIVKKYKPKIVAITGSVGKTTTKEACFSALASKFNVRRNIGNYNNEIGLPLAIIGKEKSPGRYVLKWLGVYFSGISFLIAKRKYPDILILEMGADKPGDISELLEIFTPDVGIITAICPTHIEKFKSISGVLREKGKLFKSVSRSGWIIVNADRGDIVEIADKCEAKKSYIGLCGDSDINVCASEIAVSVSEGDETGISGISFKLHSKGAVTPVLLRGVLGEHQVYPALFAASCAQIFGVNMVEAAEGLRNMRVQPGRMRILPGIKNTIIIDDTYNSSPDAAKCAIETLSKLSVSGKKYAVLGDMLELGAQTERFHNDLGALVASLSIDYLVAVGERARDIARGASGSGMDKDSIFDFADNQSAGLFVQSRLEKGDLTLVKGSRGMKMENLVREIMAHPEKSGELLVGMGR